MTIHPPRQTQDGLDMMLMVNFLSNAILIKYFVNLKLFNQPQGSFVPRIVATSSDTHRWHKYHDFERLSNYSLMGQVDHYGNTKLWNQMLINYYADEYKDKIDCYGHCPGPVYSEIARHAPWYMRLFAHSFMGVLFQGIDRGGQHIVYSCMQSRDKYPSGTYHWMQWDAPLSEDSLNKEYQNELMKHVKEIIDELEQRHGSAL